MINVSFSGHGGSLCGFCVCGHSGYATAGEDIVCAAVSAMTMLTVNMLTDTFGLDCELKVDENSAEIALSLKQPDALGSKIISALRAELVCLAEEYPQNILVKE